MGGLKPTVTWQPGEGSTPSWFIFNGFRHKQGGFNTLPSCFQWVNLNPFPFDFDGFRHKQGGSFPPLCTFNGRSPPFRHRKVGQTLPPCCSLPFHHKEVGQSLSPCRSPSFKVGWPPISAIHLHFDTVHPLPSCLPRFRHGKPPIPAVHLHFILGHPLPCHSSLFQHRAPFSPHLPSFRDKKPILLRSVTCYGHVHHSIIP